MKQRLVKIFQKALHFLRLHAVLFHGFISSSHIHRHFALTHIRTEIRAVLRDPYLHMLFDHLHISAVLSHPAGTKEGNLLSPQPGQKINHRHITGSLIRPESDKKSLRILSLIFFQALNILGISRNSRENTVRHLFRISCPA